MPVLDINQPPEEIKPQEETAPPKETSVPQPDERSFPNFLNAPPGYEWSDRWNERPKIDIKEGLKLNTAAPPQTVSPSDPYRDMEDYDKLNAVERWMGSSLPTSIQRGKEKLEAFLPGKTEKLVYGAGNLLFKAMSIFDAAGEFVERGSGFVRQFKLAQENDDVDNFMNNVGDAWAAGSMFYDVSNAPMFQDGKLTFHTDLPSTSELPKLRKRITELTDQGVTRKAALEQTKSEYMSNLGALSIRAAKQDLLGHVIIDPFMWLTLGGYAPVDIVKSTAVAARMSKYSVGYLDELADLAKIAEKAGDTAKAAEYLEVIAHINKTMKPITAWDKAAMFLTGEFPEPAAGAGKVDEMLYFFGNTLAQSETTGGKAWRKLNPFSLTPEARYHEWSTRLDDYLGNHVLSQGDPYKITEALTELASQATSGKPAAIAATADGRMIQSYLRAAEVDATQLLNDFRKIAPDGELLEAVAEKLGVLTPDLIDNFIAGKGDDIARQLARLDDDGMRLALQLTPEKMDLLGNLKGTAYTEDLFRRMLNNQILDDMAKMGIVKFGIKQKGLIQKWTAFMKAGETMAFLRMNPTFAAKNWINNEFTMIARGVGGGFFGREDDLVKLIDKLGFEPLRASQAWTMAGMTGETIGDVGVEAAKTIAKQLEGDAKIIDKWAKAINKADMGWLDFGKVAQRVERSASQRAMVKGYTRAWRSFWKPGGFTSASKFLPQNIIRELGEDAVRRIDNVLQDASSMDDIDKIFSSLSNIDLNSSASGVINDVERRIGVDLGTQFEEIEIEAIRDGISRAIASGKPKEAEKIFDGLFEETIKRISRESDEMLQTKLAKFEQAVEGERSMALLDLTEEITNQLDISNYTYSVGMARFRPQDVSKEVRDAYWPIWLKQQNQHFENVYKRIDSAIDGVRKGGQNIDLNLDQALKNFDNQKNVWDNFFTKRNKLYQESKEAGWENWDEIVEEIDAMYIAASETDLAVVKDIDDLMTEVVRKNNPELADGFAGWRAQIREWKVRDRAQTRTYTYSQKRGELPTDAPTYSGFWQERGALHEELWDIKQRGYRMMEGDPDELARFSASAPPRPDAHVEIVDDVAQIVPTPPTVSLERNFRAGPYNNTAKFTNEAQAELYDYGSMLRNQSSLKFSELHINDRTALLEKTDALKASLIARGVPEDKIDDIALRVSEDVRSQMKGAKDKTVDLIDNVGVPKVSKPSERLVNRLAKDLEGQQTTMRFGQASESELSPTFMNEAREEQWFSRSFFTLKEIEEETLKTLRSPVSRLDDVSDAAKGQLDKYFKNAKREMADAQYASLRMAEYSRDSALLNYNRKMNYDTWLGTFMPYEFWMTHSMGQWAIQSLNRPAVMAFYNRVRTLQDRIGIDDESYPTRLHGKMKIHTPWLPDWMGDNVYVDPLNVFSPFGQMSMPYQLAKQKGLAAEGRVERELQRMVRDGDITPEQAQEAMATQEGPVFQQAFSAVEAGHEGQTDNYELLSALSSFHAPYDVAYKALTGQPENIGPFLPATFTVTRLLGAFGVDLPHEDANVAARLRRRMGLPGFDQWEDYRVERMLANMSATGEITPDASARAMISHEGDVWELAREKAAREYAGGTWWTALLKTAGAPTYIYPEGEHLQRQLGDKFGKAMEAYEAGDNEAYNKFWDDNPEFANRLSLWDEPEERMRNFLVDDVWNMYSDLGSLDKKILRETLGDEFGMRFLNEGTRNYEAIPIEQLQMWAKMMGGDPPGTLTEAFPIDFAPPEVANQAQIFYDVRNESFPDFYELQNRYFDLAKGQARKDYIKQYPQLKQYWDWRRDFLKRNPSIAAYIDDEFEPNYSSVPELEQAYEQEPAFQQVEFQRYLESSEMNIILSIYNDDFVPPQDIVEHLARKAEELGMTYDELIEKVGTSR